MPHLPRPCRLLLATFAGLAGTLAAQRPLLHGGGATPDFADVPAAVAAAPVGAVILCAPGTYTGFSTQKPLRVQLGGATVLPAAGSANTIEVHDLPPGEAFALAGGNGTIAAGALGCVRLHGNGAPVVLERFTAAAIGNRSGLEVQDCAAVLMHHCILGGAPALQVQWASFACNESIVLSTNGAGAVVDDSLFESVRTSFTGTGMPALRGFRSAMRLAGDGSIGLSVIGGSSIPVSAFEAVQCTVQWQQSRFPLGSLGGAPGFVAIDTTVWADDVPVLAASDAAPGTTATARMSSNTPTIGAIVMGYAVVPALFGITGIYLDTVNAPVIAAFGLVDAAGLPVFANVPASNALRGELFNLQGVVWSTAGVPLLSGPGTWTIL